MCRYSSPDKTSHTQKTSSAMAGFFIDLFATTKPAPSLSLNKPLIKTIEIKAFVPSKDFKLSKQFYQDLGFELVSVSNGIAYFKSSSSSFLLQDFYEEKHATNFMMHLLVDDIVKLHSSLKSTTIEKKYKTKITDIKMQPWNMYEFCVVDPSGVLWRIAQNIFE